MSRGQALAPSRALAAGAARTSRSGDPRRRPVAADVPGPDRGAADLVATTERAPGWGPAVMLLELLKNAGRRGRCGAACS